MSRLRARCPDCRTLTAVALGPEYQCHSCGREFGAGLVRIVDGPVLDGLAYPEAAVVRGDDDVRALLPERPIVLGGVPAMHARIEAALGGGYVVVDGDLASLGADELAALEDRLRERAKAGGIRGAGFPGLSEDALNAPLVERMACALGL